MSDEMDPEILADLELRESTMRDRTRERRTPGSLQHATTAATVAWWSCRNAKCRKPCEVPAEAIEAFEVFNRKLRADGEQPLTTADVLMCAECRALFAAHRSERARKRCDELHTVVQKLRASTNPRAQHDLCQEAQRLQHPDLEGLLTAIEARLKSGKGKSAERRI